MIANSPSTSIHRILTAISLLIVAISLAGCRPNPPAPTTTSAVSVSLDRGNA